MLMFDDIGLYNSVRYRAAVFVGVKAASITYVLLFEISEVAILFNNIHYV